MPPEEKKVLSAPPPKKRGKFGFVVGALLLAGTGTWFFIVPRDPSAAQAHALTQVRSTLHLDTFVLNLADSDQRSYLRVGIDLGLNREEQRGEIAPIAEVRDTILGILAQGEVDDLLTAAGKTKLKQDLLMALQVRLPQLGVQEVYFTEFLIQR